MAGSDRGRVADWSPEGPVFVLVRPQMGENIGAAARAMWNFGLRRLRLVAPRDGWPNPKAAAMASGAGALLDEAMLSETLEPALADLSMVYATTARPRDLAKRVLTPEAAVAEMRALIAGGARVGVMFGSERAGLDTGEVLRAGAIVEAPTNPAFASINLAQAALMMAYEWRRQSAAAPPERRPAPAAAGEVAALADHLEAELDAAGYFFPEHRRAVMRANLRNMIHRMDWSTQETRTLRGVVRALAEGRRRRAAALPGGDGAAISPANRSETER